MWLVVAACSGVACEPHQASAQAMPASIRPGAELSLIDTASLRQRATYLEASEQNLQVRISCGAGCERASTIPWNALSQVDAKVGHVHSARRAVAGGVIGGVGALGAMALVGVLLDRSRATQCHFDQGECPTLGLAILTPVAVLAGGVIGVTAGWRHERFTWERIWPASGSR
jgi:hypothetical protein